MDNEKKVTLNGEEITTEELKEKKENLPSNQRIVEVSEDTYETLERMHG